MLVITAYVHNPEKKMEMLVKNEIRVAAVTSHWVVKETGEGAK